MSFRIPLFDLNYDSEEEEAVLEVLRSRWISAGPKTAELEADFAQALGAKHAVALTNCTTALHLAMKLIGIGPGDEVICPSLTFVATANSICYAGGAPVFCDVTSVENPTLDPERFAAAITPETKAVVVMHYAGFPCDMDAISSVARDHGIEVIEDACHGPLSEYKGTKLGTIGTIGCFSFFSNKNMSTGEGGILVTNDEGYAQRARPLRSHGMTAVSYDKARGHATSYDVVELGFNYKIDDIRSALGVVQLRKLPADLERRVGVREAYVLALHDCPGITIPFLGHEGMVSNYIFPIVLKDSTAENRDRVRAELREAGIETTVHYPAVHRFTTHRSDAELPVTEHIADNALSLPMHGRLTPEETDYVAAKLKEAL